MGSPSREVISGPRAYVIVPTTYTFKPGGISKREIAQMTFVLEKQGADWKIQAWTRTGAEAAPVN